MMRSGLAGLLALGAALPAAADDTPSALEPYQVVRSLELVQDRLAAGDHASQPMQRTLLEMIDASFATREGSRFENALNRRAVLVYAMSGGNPATVETAIAHLGADDPNRALGEKILFYVNGKTEQAQEAFASVDPMAYTPDIGMYLALVKGSTLAQAEPAQALAMLDKARLLGPGTLVEEAALRRSLPVAAALGDARRFQRLAQQYVEGYLRSPYAGQFADAFVAGVVALNASIDRKELAAIVEAMEPEQEKVIYLRIARRAAIDGLIELAAFAATQAEGVGDDPRAELYASLSSVTSGNVGEVIDKLAKIDRDSLSENDRELLEAASAIASGLTTARATAEPAEPPPPAIRSVGPQDLTPETDAGQSPKQSPKQSPEQAPEHAPAPAAEAPPQVSSGEHASPAAPAAAKASGEDDTVQQAEAAVAATRAKLAEIDKLIGDMPE